MSLLRNMQARLRREAAKTGGSSLPDSEDHGENFLINRVIAMDRSPEVIRGGKGYIHGSSLIGLCARRQVLSALAGGTDSKAARPQERVMWAIGRSVEEHVRGQFIKSMKRKGIIGQWTCPCGSSKREGEYSKSVKCDTCQKGLTEYREIPLFDHSNRIVGNGDLLYLRPDNLKLRVVEIKSKKQELFVKLSKPEPDHILQASIYRRLSQINGSDVDDYVSIVYASKDFVFKGLPYKEYHVKINQAREDILDTMWGRAEEVKETLKALEKNPSGPLPERLPACASDKSPKAKGCDQCTACFAHQ